MSFNPNSLKPTDLIQLNSDIQLSLPISIGVLRSKDRLNYWQSKAYTHTIFYFGNYIALLQFFIFYFALDMQALGLIWIGLIIGFFFVNKTHYSKSDFIFEPNRFYKGEVVYRYIEILKIYEDRLELFTYFKKNIGIVHYDDIKYVKAHYYKTNKGLKIKYNSSYVKRTGSIRYRFSEQLFEISSSNIVLNKRYSIELRDLTNIISCCLQHYKNKL